MTQERHNSLTSCIHAISDEKPSLAMAHFDAIIRLYDRVAPEDIITQHEYPNVDRTRVLIVAIVRNVPQPTVNQFRVK